MPVLKPPDADDAIDLTPEEVPSWDELAKQQQDAGQTTIDFAGELAGDILALYDRTSLTEEWGPHSRRIFAWIYSETNMCIYDENGQVLDEPEHFTPAGIQPLLMSGDSDHSFQEEFKEFYDLPDITGPFEQPAAAPVAAAAEADEPAAQVAGMMEDAGTLMEDAVGVEGDAVEVVQPPEQQRSEMRSALTAQTRVRLPPPGSTDNAAHPATLVVVKESVVALVWDDPELVPQHGSITLTDPVVDALLAVEDGIFIVDAADVAPPERCVGMFLARCNKEAEGYFYGANPPLGQNACFVAPDVYRAVPCKTANCRFPHSFRAGTIVKAGERTHEYVFVTTLISAEPGQVRFWALLGDEDALAVSSTLRPRYFVVPFMRGREANMEVPQPATQCETDALERFQAGTAEFLAEFTVWAARKGQRGLPCEAHPDSIHTPAAAPAELGRARLRPRPYEPAVSAGDVSDSDPDELDPSLYVLPSQIPFDLRNVGPKKFSDGMKKGLPPPTRAEIEQLCDFYRIPTTGASTSNLIKALLGIKRSVNRGGAAAIAISDDDDDGDTAARPPRRSASSRASSGGSGASGAVESETNALKFHVMAQEREMDTLRKMVAEASRAATAASTAAATASAAAAKAEKASTSRKTHDRPPPPPPPLPPPPPPPPPPPSLWQAATSGGKTYYWNTETREVVWEPPAGLVTASVTSGGVGGATAPTAAPADGISEARSPTTRSAARRAELRSPASRDRAARETRREIKALKRELMEARDPGERQRLVRWIDTRESQLLDGVY